MKITKRQHEATIARLNALKVQLEDVRDNMIKALDDGFGSEEMANATNHLHDAISDVEAAIRDEEDAYSRRNWTSADYSAAELVAANID